MRSSSAADTARPVRPHLSAATSELIATALKLVLLAPTLTLPEKAVLLVLVSHLNANHQSWPSQETIARQASMTVRSVQRAITRLRKHSILSITSGDGRGNTTTYTIAFAALDALSDDGKKGDTQSPFSGRKGDTQSAFSGRKGDTQSPFSGGKGDTQSAFSGRKGDTQSPEVDPSTYLDPTQYVVPDPDQEQPASPASTLSNTTKPTRRHFAIAKLAIEDVLARGRNPLVHKGDVGDCFKARCSKQDLPNNATITQKATDAALYVYEHSLSKARDSVLRSRHHDGQRRHA